MNPQFVFRRCSTIKAEYERLYHWITKIIEIPINERIDIKLPYTTIDVLFISLLEFTLYLCSLDGYITTSEINFIYDLSKEILCIFSVNRQFFLFFYCAKYFLC